METKSLISIMLFLHVFIVDVNPAILPDRQSSKCSKNGNLNDALLKSRNVALDGLFKSFVPPYDGAQISIDGGIWAKAICPPKIKMEDCRDCVKDTIPVVKKNCPKENEGVTWSVLPKLYCMVHYANHPKQGNLAEWAWARFFTPPNHPLAPANAGELEKLVNNLASTLKEKANGVNNLDRYSSGSISYGPGSHSLYGSMHCFPGISRVDCAKCLSDATNQLHDCCSKTRKPVGRAFSVNCAFWYSHDNFLPKTLPTISSPSLRTQDP